MAKYLINEESLVGIADKTRALTSRSDDLTIAEIIEVIDLEKTYLDATLTALADKGVEVPEGTTNANLVEVITNAEFGSELNFTVVGGTIQPTSPTENTVWVNTSIPVNGWGFSAEELENPSEGMLWIEVRSSGNLVFDALKGANVLKVAPIAVRQYVENNWQIVTAEIYQGGSWETIEKTVWLLNGMNQYENITGGWLFAVTGSISGSGVKFTRRSGGANALETAKTDIDFSPYSLLTVHISANSASSWVGVTVGSSSVLSGSSAGGTPYAEVIVQNKKTGYINLDLSKVNQSGKICFNCYDTGSVTIDEIYLEY